MLEYSKPTSSKDRWAMGDESGTFPPLCACCMWMCFKDYFCKKRALRIAKGSTELNSLKQLFSLEAKT